MRDSRYDPLFEKEIWAVALEKFAAPAGLTLQLFDHESRPVFDTVLSSPMYRLFKQAGYEPGMFAECARLCLSQNPCGSREPILFSRFESLTILGVSLALEGEIAGAVVGGYIFVDFCKVSDIQRLATDSGIEFEQIWEMARKQVPVPRNRLMMQGELLRALGDSLLRESIRTHEYQADLADAQLLQSVSSKLSQGHGEDLYQKIVDAGAILMRSDCVSLQMLESTGTGEPELRALATRGIPVKILKFWGRVSSDSHTICAAALRAGKQIAIADFEHLEDSEPNVDAATYLDAGIRSGLSTPLLSRKGAIVGMITTHWREPHRATERQLVMLDLLVRQAADLIERERALNTLRDSEERFRALADNMSQLAWMADKSGSLVWYNRRWYDYTGTTLEEMRGWGWRKVHHPAHVERVVKSMQRSFDTGEIWEETFPLRGKDGEYRWFLSRAVPIRDAGGEILRWFGTNTDVTEQRLSQERLRRTENLAAAGQLAASTAHEINNPLSSVTNALYLLEHNPELDASAHELAAMASGELARVARIVKQSLSYYRAGSIARDIDISELTRDSIAIFQPKFEKAGIELTSDLRRGPSVSGFAGELRQVIDNLLVNALEAMPKGGRLRVSVRESNNWLNGRLVGARLTIADSGCGIPREIRQRIFEPFFTTKAEKGTGLGMWVLQSILSKHEGTINVRSSDEEGHSGTVVSVFLPAALETLRRRESTENKSVA
jgi:PAS domain S-box-containing protein